MHAPAPTPASLHAKVNRHRFALDQSTLTLEAKDALHKLMDGAEGATNGCSDKIQAMTETMLEFCLMKVDDRIALPRLLQQAAQEAVRIQHTTCPVFHATLTIDGEKLYPWDVNRKAIDALTNARPKSFLSFKWGNKTIDAGGIAAPILSVVITIAALFYISRLTKSDMRAAVTAAITAAKEEEVSTK